MSRWGAGPGAWFTARYPGNCSRCGTEFGEDFRIRSDGHGGYECCVDDDASEGEQPAQTRFVGTSDDEMGY